MTQPLKSDQRKLFAFSQCRHHLLSQQQQRRRSLPRHRECKNWCYRYWKEGKPRWLGLGSLKDVSLKDARLVRDAARLRVKGDRSAPGVDIVWRSERRLRKRKPERPLLDGLFRQPAEFAFAKLVVVVEVRRVDRLH
ncbi:MULTISPECIES: Arm DNA-binding domain-containing protein [Bradyrhizobium]|uniref:Arm DNA-binding domain-containing protein n=1 Tax=Bradyrhizobium TaxID=374 RepID=UPI003002F548